MLDAKGGKREFRRNGGWQARVCARAGLSAAGTERRSRVSCAASGPLVPLRDGPHEGSRCPRSAPSRVGSDTFMSQCSFSWPTVVFVFG